MRKKIGFIDLFIDEWHANNYPAWFRSALRKDEFEVAMAWEKRTPAGKRPLKQWCADLDIAPASSPEEVVEKCDCLCVLAPSNPEVHEELAELALKSGKPTYVDKPFAPNRAAAARMFDLARKHGTPLMSSSALRFGTELIAERRKFANPLFVNTCGGGGNFPEYAIHQIEMIVSLLGVGAAKLQVVGGVERLTATIAYPDRRLATMNYAPHWGFQLNAANDAGGIQLATHSNVFPNLIDAMLDFYATGVNQIPREETLEIAGILNAAVKGMAAPESWIAIE